MIFIKKLLSKVRYLCQILLINEIPPKFLKKVKFPHPIGIVIASDVEIGNTVTIYQNVTIGRKVMDDVGNIPKIGNKVTIYSGSVIAGDINVGDNVIIGANTIVTKDVPCNSIVTGINNVRNRTKNR